MDVFFVISGFLITSQLARELQTKGTISFRGFYARRIRRILPAATLTTVVTVVASALVLSPVAARRAFGDTQAAAAFVANIHFAAQDANYFSAGVSPSPMLHYWSLSVEEQFYFVWPLLLLLSSLVWLNVRRRSDGRTRVGEEPARPRRGTPRFTAVITTLGVVAVLSFAASVIQTPQSPAWSYYLITTRAWELAAGALVALSLSRCERIDGRLASGLTWAGVVGIAIAALAFNDSTPFPGVAALLPVAGAAAIIAAGAAAKSRWRAEILLGTGPFQRVGAWSYSWYLWHWPVLILTPVLIGHSLSEPQALAAAAVSLAFAVMSFAIVERPIRGMQLLVRRPELGLGAGAALVAGSLCAVAFLGPALSPLKLGKAVASPPVKTGRKLDDQQLTANLRAGLRTTRVPANLVPPLTAALEDSPLIAKNGCLVKDPITSSRGCIFGDAKSPTSVVLFGDSHAASWFPAMDLVSKQEHWRLVVLTKMGCPAEEVNVIRGGRIYTACAQWRRAAMNRIARLHPALVVVTSSQYHGTRPLAGVPTTYGTTWENGVAAILGFLRGAAQHVAFITDVPTLPESAPECLAKHISDVGACTVSRDFAARSRPFKAQELSLARRFRTNSIDPLSWFCAPTGCPVIVGNILLYQDKEHMTPEWSQFLVPVLRGVLAPIVGGTKLSRKEVR